MDYFFQDQFYGDSNFVWPNNEDVPVHVQPKGSAFVPYAYRPRIEVGSQSSGNTSNSQKASKRMIEFLRRIQAEKVESREPQRERVHYHMINERMRREREKLNYMALYSLLPPGSKSDKNSIVQVAAQRIQELEYHKQEIERRNRELNGVLEARMENNNIGGTKIKVRVISHPISGIDYMLEALKRLKNTGSCTTKIQSEFSYQKLKAVIDVDNDQMGEAEFKMAVQGALKGVEEKLHVAFPGSLELQVEKPSKKRPRLENEPSHYNSPCRPPF